MDFQTLKQKEKENTDNYYRIQEERFKIGEEICKVINIDYEKVKTGAKNPILLYAVKEGIKPTRLSLIIDEEKLNTAQKTRYEELCKADDDLDKEFMENAAEKQQIMKAGLNIKLEKLKREDPAEYEATVMISKQIQKTLVFYKD